MDRQDFTQDITAPLYFYPQQGRASATPSVEIKDQAGTTVTVDSDTNVTLDPVNTTLTAAAAPGDQTMTLTSVADIDIGVEYLVTNILGQKERVHVTGVDSSGLVVHLRDDIEHVYTGSGSDTFVGTRFYRDLQADEVDDLVELYRGRATYTVDGQEYVLEVDFDVVLTPLPNLLTAALLKSKRISIAAQEHPETRGSCYDDLRGAAWDVVRKKIRELNTGDNERWRPALVRTGDNLELWALAEFDLLAHENGVRVLRGEWSGPEALEKLEGRIEKAKAHAVAGLDWIDLNENDAREDEEEKPQTMDWIR